MLNAIIIIWYFPMDIVGPGDLLYLRKFRAFLTSDLMMEGWYPWLKLDELGVIRTV